MTNAWNNIVNGNNGSTGGTQIDYLKFPDGQTTIRLIDKEPYSRWTHWVQQANKGKGVSIDCIGKGCPICEERKKEKATGVKPSDMKFKVAMTHSINVIDRADGKVKVLEKGNGLFQDLANALTMLTTMGQAPDITLIDIIVTKSGKVFNQIKYAVMPNPSTIRPLNEEELALEKYNLEELKPKLEAFQVIQLMNGASLDEVTGGDKTESDMQPDDSQSPFNVDFSKQV